MSEPMKIKLKEPRRCVICKQPEQSNGLYTSTAPILGICVDCINRHFMGHQRQATSTKET